MLCINPRCRATIRDHYWGAGYCCGECMQVSMDPGASMSESLHEPITGRTICRNADELDLMMQAHELDPRLPRIIYEFARFARLRVPVVCRAMIEAHGIDPRLPIILFWRGQGMTLRVIALECGMSHPTDCDRILKNATPKLLRRLRLRMI